ncbi:glycine betaine ABC transporter substrate-binding protein [Nocardia sp. NPDC024068]|uniref:glycine betaine ABC transporter substrate-binding protein n=1 Tax=Nocardia sp. NPDC024068 TaxID=3157197 RepID=UPI0033E14EC5
MRYFIRRDRYRNDRNRFLATAVFALTAILLSSCSSLGPSVKPAPGSLASTIDLSGVSISVGSKNYSEQRMLGALYVTALRAAGADVVDRTGIGGTMLAYSALESNQIDLYSEYTGTAWSTILGQSEVVSDPDLLFGKVNAMSGESGLTWFAMSPANSNYAIAAPENLLQRLDINNLSDYAELARTNPAAARLCSSTEFATRDDGLPGVEKTYGFTLPREQVLIQESSISVATMTTQHQCEFSSVVAADPRLPNYGLRQLVDDRKSFPSYNPAIVMHTEKYESHKSEYDALLGEINSLITQDVLVKLNSRIQLDDQPEARVATEFLRENNII